VIELDGQPPMYKNWIARSRPGSSSDVLLSSQNADYAEIVDEENSDYSW